MKHKAFDCRLTIDEIEKLIHSVRLVCVNKTLNGDPLEDCLSYLDLQGKLIRIKEMLVSVDESN